MGCLGGDISIVVRILRSFWCVLPIYYTDQYHADSLIAALFWLHYYHDSLASTVEDSARSAA